MRYLIILVIFGLLSCNNTPNKKTIYFNATNDLQKENLFSNVKSVTTYKVFLIKSFPEKTEKVSFKKFNTNSFLSEDRSYTLGGQTLLNRYFYDNNSKLIKKVTKPFSSEVITIKYSYNERGLLEIYKIFSGKSIYENIFEYDKKKNIAKRLDVFNNDTTLNIISNRYDKSNLIIEKKEIVNNSNFITRYKYSKKNQLIEITKKSTNSTSKTCFKYIDNCLVQKKIFKDNKLEKTLEYDNFFNIISIKKNNIIQRNEYQFDQNNNWVKKSVIGDSSFYEIRKIDYY